MSEQSICYVLHTIFEENRVVFWYDDQAKLKEEFHQPLLSELEKTEVPNNQFVPKKENATKHHSMRLV